MPIGATHTHTHITKYTREHQLSSQLARRSSCSPSCLDDFTHVKDNVATVVTGRGQTVEWRNSSVTVFEKDKEGKEKRTRLPNNENGGIIVEQGWELYIASGKFVEFD